MMLRKKICLLGMFGVGKSSLVRRFIKNEFEEKYLSTLGVKVDYKTVTVATGQTPQVMELLIWDIASQDDPQKAVLNYFRGAAGALVVHDLTRPESAERLAQYCASFRQAAPLASLVFAGNKADLLAGTDFDVIGFQKQIGELAAPHFLTSAKTGENVEQAFQALAAAILENDE